MSHCISAIVTKKTKAVEGLSFRSLPQGFALLLDTESNRKVLDSQDYASIRTNYFGGFGEQSCQLYQVGNRDCICDKCGTLLKEKFEEMNSINDGLIRLGVVRKDSDEFDAINLGRYRENEDIAEQD